MKKFYKIILMLSLLGFLLSQDSGPTVSNEDRTISPTIQIRYDDFINDFTPSSSIGILLRIDDNRYTGFDVDTSTNETRILAGWKWSVMGISVKEITLEDGSIDHVSLYSFGVKYKILDNMKTTIEYVLSADSDTDDFLRLALGVEF